MTKGFGMGIDMMGEPLADGQPNNVRREGDRPVGTEGSVERSDQRMRPHLRDQLAMIARAGFHRTAEKVRNSLMVGQLRKRLGCRNHVGYRKCLASGRGRHGFLAECQRPFKKFTRRLTPELSCRPRLPGQAPARGLGARPVSSNGSFGLRPPVRSNNSAFLPAWGVGSTPAARWPT